MSETPSTDKEDGIAIEWHHSTRVVPSSFARTLERELAEWHRIAGEQIERLTRERDAARLAALREVREMVLIRTGWFVEAIDDLIKREEER